MTSDVPWGLLLLLCIARSAIEFHVGDRVQPEALEPNWVLDYRQDSHCLGKVALVATAVHFGFMASWYWALILLVAAHFGGVFGTIPYAAVIGRSRVLPLSYFAWPSCLVWANIIIHRTGHPL